MSSDTRPVIIVSLSEDGQLVLHDTSLTEPDSDTLDLFKELHQHGHDANYLIQYASDLGFRVSAEDLQD